MFQVNNSSARGGSSIRFSRFSFSSSTRFTLKSSRRAFSPRECSDQLAQKYGKKWHKAVNVENIELRSPPKKKQQVEEQCTVNNEYTRTPKANLRPKQLRTKSYNLALRQSVLINDGEVSSYSFGNRSNLTLGKRSSCVEPDTEVFCKINKANTTRYNSV